MRPIEVRDNKRFLHYSKVEKVCTVGVREKIKNRISRKISDLSLDSLYNGTKKAMKRFYETNRK